MVERVRETATKQLTTQKERATDVVGGVAEALRQSTGHLRGQQHTVIAEYVEKAAEQIDRFSTQVRERDVRELMNDVQDFARRRPAVFMGSAFALGLVGARFLKSSRDQEDHWQRGTFGHSTRRTTGTGVPPSQAAIVGSGAARSGSEARDAGISADVSNESSASRSGSATSRTRRTTGTRIEGS